MRPRFCIPSYLALYNAVLAEHRRSNNVSRPVINGSDSISFRWQNFNASNARPLHCIRSWAIYEASTAAAIEVQTEYNTTLIRDTLTLGNASVYTERDGFPVASGDYTSTALIVDTLYRTKTSPWMNTLTKGPWPQSTPRCKSLCYSDRSRTCDSYLSDAGFLRSGNSRAPPTVWYDSVACPLPYTTCTLDQAAPSGCSVDATNAVLYYFGAPEHSSSGCDLSTDVWYSHLPGVTFTSPSIYISFGQLTATSKPWTDIFSCSMCNYGSCTAMAPFESSTDGTKTIVSNSIITLPPEGISTVIINADSIPEKRVYDILAHFSREPSAIMDPYEDNAANTGLKFQSLMVTDLAHPPATAYYLNPFGAPGCGAWYEQDGDDPSPECNTIFEDQYTPYVALPLQSADLLHLGDGCQSTAGIQAKPVQLSNVTSSVATTSCAETFFFRWPLAFFTQLASKARR